MKRTALALTVLLTAAVLSAQAPPAAPPVPEIFQRILSLEGKWVAPATIETGGKSTAFSYTCTFRRVAGDSGIAMTEDADIAGMGRLMAENLIGYDPFSKQLNWYTVDNMGTAHSHACSFKGKDHFQMVHDGKRDGKPFHEVVDLEWKGENAVHVVVVSTLDGKPDSRIEGTFERKK